MIIANVAKSLFFVVFCILWWVYFSQILIIVIFSFETAAVKICFIFYLNYLMGGFLPSIFSNLFFWTCWMYLSFHFFSFLPYFLPLVGFFSLFFLTHLYTLYPWPYLPTLLLISLFLPPSFASLQFFFQFPDCSFFIVSCSYSMRAMYFIVSLSILMCGCMRSFLLPAVLFSSNLFCFYLLALGLVTFLRWLAILACQHLFKSQGQKQKTKNWFRSSENMYRACWLCTAMQDDQFGSLLGSSY